MTFAEHYGSWALIAGASEGTGASFARQLAEQGLNVILIARRPGPLNALAAEIRSTHNVSCITATIDLSRPDAVARMAELTAERDVGLLILNAGSDPNGSNFLDNELANWDQLVARNVTTVMEPATTLVGKCGRDGAAESSSSGSGACYFGLPGVAAYGATKAFNLLLGESLWAELQPHGIDVLNLVMGKTDTPAHRELMERLGVPFPTNCASPDEVAALGLARLQHGPVVNWGLADDEDTFVGISAAGRRQRATAMAAMAADYYRET